jgi:superoxide dismutase
MNTANADTLTENAGLLYFDIRGHGYYRQKYIDNFLKLVNWKFVSNNLK